MTGTTTRATWTGRVGAQPLVLIHGLGGSRHAWDRVVPLLDERLRIAALDLPGGQSIQEEANAVAQVLTDACSKPAVLCGHSLGGLIATSLAEQAPHLVQALIVVNSPANQDARISARSVPERALQLPVLGRLLWQHASDRRLRKGLHSAFAKPDQVPDQFVADLRATSHQQLTESSAAADFYLAERSLDERFGHIPVPVDVVFGMLDQRVKPESTLRFEGLAHTTVTLIPTAGHSPPWETPETLAEIILDRASRS